MGHELHIGEWLMRFFTDAKTENNINYGTGNRDENRVLLLLKSRRNSFTRNSSARRR